MPIQFRCPACERLLGIARRKAGTQVNCPRCGASVRVPALVGTAATADEATLASLPVIEPEPRRRRKRPDPGKTIPLPNSELNAMPLFERPDFESLLNPAARRAKSAPAPQPPPPAPPPAAAPLPAPAKSLPDVDVVPAVVVSRKHLTFVAVLIAILIGIAFAAGYVLAALTLTTKAAAG